MCALSTLERGNGVEVQALACPLFDRDRVRAGHRVRTPPVSSWHPSREAEGAVHRYPCRCGGGLRLEWAVPDLHQQSHRYQSPVLTPDVALAEFRGSLDWGLE